MKNKIVFAIVLWALATLLLGYFEVFVNLPRQVFGISVFLIVVASTYFYFKNKPFQNFITNFSLKQIAIIHIFRIFAGSLFLFYKSNLPETFATKAGYGDIIAGILALSVFLLGHRKINYYIFNLFGIIDLISALSIGTYFNLTNDPQMAFIFTLPLLLIPVFIVPLLLVSHIASLQKLNSLNKVSLFETINETNDN